MTKRVVGLLAGPDTPAEVASRHVGGLSLTALGPFLRNRSVRRAAHGHRERE